MQKSPIKTALIAANLFVSLMTAFRRINTADDDVHSFSRADNKTNFTCVTKMAFGVLN